MLNSKEALNVLIPMAGVGSRFQNAGYLLPKPIVDVKGKPMIQIAVENLKTIITSNFNFIFVVQKTHREKYELNALLNEIAPNCNIIETNEVTRGAACTALLAKPIINNELPLIITNSDQYIEWNFDDFISVTEKEKADGGILTFESTDSKWSFAKVNKGGYVTEVAEKNPISNIATAGIYYWKRGKDFVLYAEQMIKKNITVNNEFYVCPVFNEAILDNKQIKNFNVKEMWSLGTPEELNEFIINKL